MSIPPKFKWDAPGHWGALTLTLLGVGTDVACEWLCEAVCDLDGLRERGANSWPPEMRIGELAKAHKDSLESCRALSPSQLATLFPNTGLPQMDRFDIPMIYAIVRYTFPTPDGKVDPGWSHWTKEPSAFHQGGIFEIIRLRSLFAELRSTCPEDVTDEEFRRLWSRLRGGLLRLCPEYRRSQLEKRLAEKRGDLPSDERVASLQALLGLESSNKKKEDGKRSKNSKDNPDDSNAQINQVVPSHQAGGRRASMGRKAFSSGGGHQALLSKFRTAGHKVLEDVRQQAARAKNKLGPGETDQEDCPSYILRPMNKVAEFLKQRYEELFANYHPIPWVHHLQVPLQQLYVELVPVEEAGGPRRDTCSAVDLFPEGEPQGWRILVEGDFSAGKTTLCHKLALEWAKGNLPQFRLVFVVHLKHVQGPLLDTLYKDIKKTSGTSVNREEFTTFLRCHQRSVLLLLDGLDEVDAEAQDNTDAHDLLKSNAGGQEDDEEPDTRVGGAASLAKATVLFTARPVGGPVSGVDARYRLQSFTREMASQFISRQVEFLPDKEAVEGMLRLILRNHGTSTALVHPLILALITRVINPDDVSPEATLTQIFTLLHDRLLEEFVLTQGKFCKSHGILDGSTDGMAEILDLQGEIAWKSLRDGRMVIPVKTLQQQVGTRKWEVLQRLGLLTVHECESALGATRQAEFVARPLAEYSAAWWLARKAHKEDEDLKPLLREIHVSDFYYQVSSKRVHNPNVYQFAFGLLHQHPEAAVRLLRTLCDDGRSVARDHDDFPWWCACYPCIHEAGEEAGAAAAVALLPYLERKLLSLDFDRSRQTGTKGLVQVMRVQQAAGRGHGVRFESGEALKELLGFLGNDRYRYDMVELHVDSWECWHDDDDLRALCCGLLNQFRCRVLRLSIPPMFCVQALHESVLPLMGSAGVTTLALDFHLDHFPAPVDSSSSSTPRMAMDEVVRAVARAVATCRDLRYLRVQFGACPDVQFECSSRALQELNDAIDARGPRLTVDLSWPFVE